MPPRKSRRTIEDIERDARAVELRRRKLNYRQIADQMGYASASSAREAVQRGLRDTIAEPSEEVRQMMLDSLDDLARTVLRVMSKPHLVVSQGRVMLDPRTGEPLQDPAPVLAGVDRLLKIGAQVMDLRGLKAPVRAEVRAEVRTVDDIDAEIRDLVVRLAGRDGQPLPGREATPTGSATG